MFGYVVKRVLLMIPTLFGISLVLWLVMAAAPGRPRGQGSEESGEEGMRGDPTRDAAKGEAEAIFRRQFALDRPVFWNGWTTLSVSEVREALDIVEAPLSHVGARHKREAQERLEDWGPYAVPGLVALLDERRGEALDAVQYWLRRSALERTVASNDPKVVAENRRKSAENAELARIAWPSGADDAKRTEGVARWKAWFSAHEGRWRWTALERLKLAVTDTQFGTYWARLIRFDFGTSHVYKRPVFDLIVERLPITLTLSLLAIVIAYLLAIPLGIFSATRPGGASDRSISVVLFLLYSLPSFFVGTVLLRSFTATATFPTSGFQDPASATWNTWDRLKDTLWHITLPLVTMTYGSLAALSRYARSGMLDVMRADYVRTARAKGLGEREVVLRHAARNGMMPVVTLLAGFLPALVSGSIVVEFIFNLQGLGLLTIEAIRVRDYNIVVAETLLVAFLTQVGILLSDILYAVMDPRISYR